MAKVLLIVGKLCAGKTTYARALGKSLPAAVLSVDEITLLLGPYLGDRHDEIAGRVQRYLLDKSLELAASGISVILDWGFWTKAARESTREFYAARGISCEFHYLALDDETWAARVEKRNRAVAAGETEAYPMDENLLAKFRARFEPPDRKEIDVWVEN